MRTRDPAWLPDRYLPTLALVSVFFIAGAVIGCVRATLGNANPTVAIPPEWGTYFKLLWEYGKYPLIAYACGVTSLGVIAVPLLISARGFTMSVVVTGIVRADGIHGLYGYLASHGILSITCMICLFILAVQGFNAAKAAFSATANRRRKSKRSLYHIRYLLCSITIMTACTLDIMFYPALAPII